MIKRTTRKHMEEVLEQNPDWNVLDLACGRTAGWEAANTLADLNDFSDSYPDKKFVRCDASDTPFKDKEFDFVVASHIAEHVNNVEEFLGELTRISKRGYIEVPTPLFDNLVYNNPAGHVWWVTYDDGEEKMVFTHRLDVVSEMLHIPELNLLYPFFRNSIVTELYWEDDIEWKYGDRVFSYEGKTYDLSDKYTHIEKWPMGSRSR